MKVRITKKSQHQCMYRITKDDDSVASITLETRTYLVHDITHFVVEMKEFIRENMDFGTKYCLDYDDVRVGVRHGYIIAKWVVPHELAQVNTFVDHGKHLDDQLEQMDRLDQQRAVVCGIPAHPVAT